MNEPTPKPIPVTKERVREILADVDAHTFKGLVVIRSKGAFRNEALIPEAIQSGEYRGELVRVITPGRWLAHRLLLEAVPYGSEKPEDRLRDLGIKSGLYQAFYKQVPASTMGISSMESDMLTTCFGQGDTKLIQDLQETLIRKPKIDTTALKKMFLEPLAAPSEDRRMNNYKKEQQAKRMARMEARKPRPEQFTEALKAERANAQQGMEEQSVTFNMS